MMADLSVHYMYISVETGRATEAPCLCTGQLLYTLHCPKTLSIRKQILLYINWPVWLPTGVHIVPCVSDRLIFNLHTFLRIPTVSKCIIEYVHRTNSWRLLILLIIIHFFKIITMALRGGCPRA